MYEDKKCIKTNRVCVRFDDYEMENHRNPWPRTRVNNPLHFYGL